MKKLRIIALVMTFCLIFGGCAAYKEHSTEIEATVGVWYLDSYYVNTKSTAHGEAKLVINEDLTGTYTTFSEIVSGVDENGNDVLETREETQNITVTGASGVININRDGVSATYEFNVDEAAGTLHFIYTLQAGDIIHYVYLSQAAHDEETSTRTN